MPGGRPFGSTGKVKLVATEIARAALSSVDQVSLWNKHLTNKDPRVSIDALKYLSDRRWGKPLQAVQGSLDSKISITLQWASQPDWLKPQDVIDVSSTALQLKDDSE